MMAIDLFKNMEESQMISAGTTIFTEGDMSYGMMYILQDGEVDIFVHGEHIDTIGPGECLGEIGLVDHGPRSATAIAKAVCILAPINAERFQLLVRQAPEFALKVMQTLAARLRAERNC